VVPDMTELLVLTMYVHEYDNQLVNYFFRYICTYCGWHCRLDMVDTAGRETLIGLSSNKKAAQKYGT